MMPTAQKSALIINDENLNPVGDETGDHVQCGSQQSGDQSGGQRLNSFPSSGQQSASPPSTTNGGDLQNNSLQQSGGVLKSSSQSSNNSSSSAKLDLNENERSSSHERSPHDKNADRSRKSSSHQSPAEKIGHERSSHERSSQERSSLERSGQERSSQERSSQDRSSLMHSISKDSQRLLSDMTNNNIVDCLAKDSSAKDLNELTESGKQSGQSSNRDSQVSQLSQTSSQLGGQLGSQLSSNQSGNQSGNLSGNLSSNNLSAASTSSNDQKSKHKKFVNNKNRDSSSSNGSLVESTNLTATQLLARTHKEEQPAIKWKYSKTHQKRFKRRFPAIEEDEQLIDWFSCALIADILLQGYLYISENYFAFYSNIFGYKTHVLVKVSDVYAITKEKTARIFPNAVGIHTKQAKFVFGSLLSRESTFKLLNEVRGSYQSKEKTPDFSEDDLLESSLKLNSTLKRDSQDANATELISLKDFKDINLNKKHPHSDEADHLEHSLDKQLDRHLDLDLAPSHHVSKLDSLRRHRRSSSLKSSSTKETPDAELKKQLTQSKLLNESESFTDFNSLLLKLSSIKSILRVDLKGSKSSFLIVSIAFLLFLLLISISVLLIRINSAHDKLISLSKYSRAMSIPEVDLFHEMFRMIEVMKSNLHEISQLKSKIN